MELLRDVYSFGQLQVLSEVKGNGRMKLRGLFQEAEKVNGNKRIYPKKLLEREINNLRPMLKERRLVGELDHPKDEIVHLINASHVITDLCMENNQVIGELEVLDTPAGKVLQELVKAGVQVGISSRATGSLEPMPNEACYLVGDSLRMITWDMVSDPSCQGAFPTLQESQSINEVRQPIVEELPKMHAEQIYIAALKRHLKK
tara:strand:- start:423 stop:1031 length:609 start_codon:yes stop_codon:yes gene_type:complete